MPLYRFIARAGLIILPCPILGTSGFSVLQKKIIFAALAPLTFLPFYGTIGVGVFYHFTSVSTRRIYHFITARLPPAELTVLPFYHFTAISALTYFAKFTISPPGRVYHFTISSNLALPRLPLTISATLRPSGVGIFAILPFYPNGGFTILHLSF